jgi:hypothetical protein
MTRYRTSSPVRPEPVEGRSFSWVAHQEGVGFDKLSPNGSVCPKTRLS